VHGAGDIYAGGEWGGDGDADGDEQYAGGGGGFDGAERDGLDTAPIDGDASGNQFGISRFGELDRGFFGSGDEFGAGGDDWAGVTA
jgi:hypothetical protein